jgi:hypothetical protein
LTALAGVLLVCSAARAQPAPHGGMPVVHAASAPPAAAAVGTGERAAGKVLLKDSGACPDCLRIAGTSLCLPQAGRHPGTSPPGPALDLPAVQGTPARAGAATSPPWERTDTGPRPPDLHLLQLLRV